MRIENIDLRGTTDASGNAVISASKSLLGRLLAVEWVDGDLVDGVDGTLKVVNRQSGVERTLLTLTNANADAFYYPREAVHDNVGAVIYYEPTSNNAVEEMPLVDGLLQLTIASGGNAKTGGMIAYVAVAG